MIKKAQGPKKRNDLLEFIPLCADDDSVRPFGGVVGVADELGRRHDTAFQSQQPSLLRGWRRGRDAVTAVTIPSPTSALGSFCSGNVQVSDGVLGDDGLLVVVAGDEANVGRLLFKITDDLLERDLYKQKEYPYVRDTF